MEKAHSRINWENYPSIATPLNETNLNKMDAALDEVDNRVLGLDTAKLDKATANTMVKDVSFDEETGIFTIELLNGTTKTIDTKLEKIATNFRYDYNSQILWLTLNDGSEQGINMSSLISQYEFSDSDTIDFSVGSDGKISAIVKEGSITEDKLQPNFLADVKTEVAKAKSYSDSAYENATASGNSASQAYNSEVNAQRSASEASNSATRSEQMAELALLHSRNYENPHNVTKEQVGLGNVPNIAPVANLLTTEPGSPLDATMGKVLDEKISAIQGSGSGTGAGVQYYVGTSSTSGSTSAKTVSITGFELKVGVIVSVKFSNTNTSSSATLNVSSTGAKAMYYMDDTMMKYIPSGLYHYFIYDGTYWRYIGTQNAIIGTRSSERYGIRMSGGTLQPIDSDLSPNIGSSSNPFSYIYSYGVSTNHLSAETLKMKVNGNVVNVLPPYPLMQGHFLANNQHNITIDNAVASNYVKGYYTGFISTGAGTSSSGCAVPCSSYATYDGVLKLRFVGYDVNQSGQIYPFSEDVVLSTSQGYYASSPGCAGQSSAYKTITLPGGNYLYIYMTGITVGDCGYISGSPIITFFTWSDNVHFLEIDLMP